MFDVGNLEAILNDVWQERERQERLCEKGRFKFTAANPGLTNVERLPILTEEIGEIARQVLQQPDSGMMPVTHAGKYDWHTAGDSEPDPQAGTPEGLRNELVQLAAISCAWIQALDSLAGSTAHAPSTQTASSPSAPNRAQALAPEER